MKKFLAALLLAPATLFAAEAGYPLEHAPIEPRDLVSLQSGARTFVNYCLNCHGAQVVD
jgi:ubiquinol-cytochrome c reductase cytochrome c1 subunit